MNKNLSVQIITFTMLLVILFGASVLPAAAEPMQPVEGVIPGVVPPEETRLLGIYPMKSLYEASTYGEIGAMDAWMGKKHSLVGTFMSIGDPCGEFCVTEPLNNISAYGYTPFINIMTTKTLAQLANGQMDASIRTWARGFRTWAKGGGFRMAYIAPLPEMNGYWTPYDGDGATFIQVFRRIRQIFTEEGVPATSVRWVFAPNGWSDPKLPNKKFENYYPGDAYVDEVSFSAYNFGFNTVLMNPPECNSYLKWVEPIEVFSEYLDRMRVMAPSKSIFIAQTGVTSVDGNYLNGACSTWNDDAKKNQWLKDAFDYLADYPGVKGLLYFNIYKPDENVDWPVYGYNSKIYEGYKLGAGNPVYGYVDPESLRHVSFGLKTLYLPAVNTPGNPFVMLGVYPQGSVYTQTTFTTELSGMETWSGKRLSLVGTNIALEDSCGDYCVLTPLDNIWNKGYTPFVNFNTAYATADIAKGNYDARIRQTARAIKTWATRNGQSRMLFLSLMPEMNSTWVNYAGTGTNFIAAYKRIRQLFTEEGVPASAVRWSWMPTAANDISHPEKAFENYYPGDGYVDVIGFSSFNIGFYNVAVNPSACAAWVEWKSPVDTYHSYLDRLRKITSSKGIIIGQTGTSSYNGSYSNGVCQVAKNDTQKNAWLNEAYNFLASYRGVIGVMYLNTLTSGIPDWAIYGNALDGSPIRFTGYTQGIANGSYKYLAPADLMKTSMAP